MEAFDETQPSINDVSDSSPLWETESLVIELMRYYGECGAPSHRCEDRASKLFTALGFDGATVQCLSTGQTFTFRQHRTVYVDVQNKQSLRGIEDVEACVKATRKDSGSFAERATRVLAARGEAFHWLLVAIAQALSPPLAVVVFFGGSFQDMAVALVLGIIATLISLPGKWGTPEFQGTWANVFPVLIGFVVALLSRSANALNLLEVSCVRAVQLGIIVDLLPGVSIATSVLEIAANNSISGTSRLFSALVRAFLLGYGLAYGNLLAAVWSPDLPTASTTCIPSEFVSPLFYILFVPLQLFGYAILLNAPIKRWPAMFIAGIVSWCVTFAFRYVPLQNGVEGLQTAVAAFLVGLVGGLSEKLTKGQTSSMSPILQGILLLVPGAVAVTTLEGALVGSVSNGLDFGLRFFSIAVSITVGLFLASVVFVLPVFGRKSTNSTSSRAKILL